MFPDAKCLRADAGLCRGSIKRVLSFDCICGVNKIETGITY